MLYPDPMLVIFLGFPWLRKGEAGVWCLRVYVSVCVRMRQSIAGCNNKTQKTRLIFMSPRKRKKKLRSAELTGTCASYEHDCFKSYLTRRQIRPLTCSEKRPTL